MMCVSRCLVTCSLLVSSLGPADLGHAATGDLSRVRVRIRDENFPVNFASNVFVGGAEGPEGTSHYRIPALVVAPDGSVLAFAEGRRSGADPGAAGLAIDMVMKRSTDGGRRWGDLVVLHKDPRFDYSDPRPIADEENGQVHLLYVQWPDDCGQACVPPGLGETSSILFLQTSSNGGQTWSGPANINAQVKDPLWRALNCGPGHAIQLKWQADPGRNGRLLVPGHYNGLVGVSIFSDDGGSSWRAGTGLPNSDLNESEAVELANGDVLWDGRQSRGSHRHRYLSQDGGQTWQNTGPGDIQITPVDCSLARFSARREGHDRDRLIFSGPLGNPPGSGSGRHNMGLWTSYDEGKTFINPVQVDAGFGAYSALQRLHDGTIGLLYEEAPSTLIRIVNCSIAALENGPHHKALSCYDGFGNAVDPRGGGMGWSGCWSGEALYTRDFSEAFGDASILYDGFPFAPQGGRVDLVDGAAIRRHLATPIDMAAADTVYVSMLVSRALDTSADGNHAEELMVGLYDNQGMVGASWGIASNESFYISSPDSMEQTDPGSLSPAGVYFLAAKLTAGDKEPGGRGRICLHAFTSGDDQIALHDAGFSWRLSAPLKCNTGATVRYVVVSAGSSAVWSIDEIRVGTSYEAVVRPRDGLWGTSVF